MGINHIEISKKTKLFLWKK